MPGTHNHIHTTPTPLQPFNTNLTTAMLTEPEFMRMMDYEARGIPFGRPAEVNLRNNHAQYIFTWYVKKKSNPSLPPSTCKGMGKTRTEATVKK